MFCPECGCKLDDGAKFCADCGVKIDDTPINADIALLPSCQDVTISSSPISSSTTEVVIIDNKQEMLRQRSEHMMRKRQRKEHIKQTGAYSLSNGIAKYLDGYHLDPLVGFVPIIGDVSPFVFSLPCIYLSLVHIKSIPLALAMVFNVLIDIVVGMIPFYIGNIADFFVRAYKRNLDLVEGFLNEDKKIIEEVNTKAVFTSILIIVICLIIYWLISIIQSITEWIGSWFS